MRIEVGIFLFGHQADDAKLGNYGRVIHAIGEKRAPYTVSLTEKTLKRIHDGHPLLKSAIQKYFPENAGALNPYDLEIGISTCNHFPLVPMWLELGWWGRYFQFTDEQIRWCKERLWYDFGKNSRGIFPPECIFAPAAVHYLKKNWLHYSMIDGAHLSGWEKGQVFQHQGLKLVVRNNEIPIENPDQVRDDILKFAKTYGVSRIVLGRDLDEFCNYHRPVHDGVALLCQISDALYAEPSIEFKNIASIADGSHNPMGICQLYQQKGIQDPWHYTTSWIDGNGRLDWLTGESAIKNQRVNDFIRRYFSRCASNDIKNRFYQIAGMEFRHPDWTSQGWFNDFFHGNMDELMRDLR